MALQIYCVAVQGLPALDVCLFYCESIISEGIDILLWHLHFHLLTYKFNMASLFCIISVSLWLVLIVVCVGSSKSFDQFVTCAVPVHAGSD